MATERTSRISNCQRLLAARDAAVLAISPSANMRYLSGFTDDPSERHLFLFIPVTGDPIFVAPAMYKRQISETSSITDIRTWSDANGPRNAVEDALNECNATDGTLLVNSSMWATFLLDLQSWFPQACFERASNLTAALRMQKDQAELDALRRAGQVADRVSEEVRAFGSDAVGLTERELAKRIERHLLDSGDEIAFDIIIGSGPNGAHPHHRHSDREIMAGDPVVLDFGVFIDGYPSDQTRTVVFDGDPPEGFKEAHEVVVDALNTGVESVEPGVEAGRIDEIVRSVIEEAGYGEHFTHRTGHGVGLEVHEAPYIVAGNKQTLEPGMVFSIEPGIYVDGTFGVRVEDLVVVTEDGCKRLNNSPRKWMPL